MIISHGYFISVFDVIQCQYLNHIRFPEKILKIFRQQVEDEERDEDKEYVWGILLEDGSLYYYEALTFVSLKSDDLKVD